MLQGSNDAQKAEHETKMQKLANELTAARTGEMMAVCKLITISDYVFSIRYMIFDANKCMKPYITKVMDKIFSLNCCMHFKWSVSLPQYITNK